MNINDKLMPSALQNLIYDSSKTYNEGDVVCYNNVNYVCFRTSTGNLPTNIDYWTPYNSYVGSNNAYAISSNNYLSKNGWNIQLSYPKSIINQPQLVKGPSNDSEWIQVPTDLWEGIRYVDFLEPGVVMLTIKGMATDGNYAQWNCRYDDNKSPGWTNWVRQTSWGGIQDKPNILFNSIMLTRNSPSDNYTINFTNYLSGFTGSFLMLLTESQGGCTGIWGMTSTSWNYNRKDFDGARATEISRVQNYNSPRTYLTVTINSGSADVIISGGIGTRLQMTLIGNNPFA